MLDKFGIVTLRQFMSLEMFLSQIVKTLLMIGGSYLGIFFLK